MLTLTKKLRRSTSNQESLETNNNVNKRVSVRDRLLVKELSDLTTEISQSTSILSLTHPDADKLHEFRLLISPEEGFWAKGKFVFEVNVSEEYNFAPPTVRCLTPLWHPNISEDGSVCLSLLRQSSIDELGWVPTRTLKDVVWGLSSLFTDLLNFDDPLNITAAEMYQRDPDAFKRKVRDYMSKHCK